MSIHLTEKEIKSILKKDRQRAVNPYKDKADVMIDSIVSLHEGKKIDKHTVNTLVSLVLISIAQDTISNLTTDVTNDLAKKNFMSIPRIEQNKIFLLNYSKQSYA